MTFAFCLLNTLTTIGDMEQERWNITLIVHGVKRMTEIKPDIRTEVLLELADLSTELGAVDKKIHEIMQRIMNDIKRVEDDTND